ncbi:RING-type zinc-finger LisH dimerization motif [Trinorchestia longiramus]|nr:RING-type zinc-finger LisH dimerization motif [Trinorchestia longiramus]
MPIQSSTWSDFLSCPMCYQQFNGSMRAPVSLGCGHTLCEACINKLRSDQCPFDQMEVHVKISQLPINPAVLSLVEHDHQTYRHDPRNSPAKSRRDWQQPPTCVPSEHLATYASSVDIMCKLAYFLKPVVGGGNSYNNSNMGGLSRSMQRKLITLINCQLLEKEGRARAMRAARSLGERTVTELILHHQNHQQLSANLWAAVRARGCQFLGPAMQEEVIKLVLLALEDGSPLSRKVLVMFVVQRLEPHFPQASKTSIGHVVQLLYRASCFKVSKRDRDSSLMQLKEEFRCYDSLRREHDTQIVQIATEAGLRIAPDQWSSLLYGDVSHKSHMQSIMDKLQTPQSFAQSVNELQFVLQRTGDPSHLYKLWPHLEMLASLDAGSPVTNGTNSDQPIEAATKTPAEQVSSNQTSEGGSSSDESSKSGGNATQDSHVPGAVQTVEMGSWSACGDTLRAVHLVLLGLVQFLQHSHSRRIHDHLHHHNSYSKRPMPPRQAFSQHRRNNVPNNNVPHNNRLRPNSHNNTAAFRSPAYNNKQYGGQKEQPAAFSPESSSSSSAGTTNTDMGYRSQQYSNNHDDNYTPQPKSDHQYNKEETIQRNYEEVPYSSSCNSENTGTRLAPTITTSRPSKMTQAPSDICENKMQMIKYTSTMGSTSQYKQMTAFNDSEGSSVGGYAEPDFSSPYHAYSPVPPPPPRVLAPPTNMIGTASPYPQAPTPILTADVYPTVGTPHQAVLVNPMPPMNHMAQMNHMAPMNHMTPVPPPVYNVVPPNVEFVFPMSKNHAPPLRAPQPVFPSLQAIPQQIPSPHLFSQTAIMGPWYGLTSFVPQNVREDTNTLQFEETFMPENNYCSHDVSGSSTSLGPISLQKKSLSELQEMKENIVSRLIDIVGEKQTEEVEEHIAKNQSHIPCVIPQTSSEESSALPAFTSTYSIWTSGTEFYKSCRLALRTSDCDIDSSSRPDSGDGSMHENGGTVSSITAAKPSISCSLRSPIHSNPPIQVSASSDVNYTTTSTLNTNCSLISLPTLQHQAVMYPAGPPPVPGLNCPSFGLYTAPVLDLSNATPLNTIQHGILDPPHLRMAQLDPSGARPSDPLDRKVGMCSSGSWEERQRQHHNAVTDGIDPFCTIKDMPEEHRLKQELSFVMHGISEKLNVQDDVVSPH